MFIQGSDLQVRLGDARPTNYFMCYLVAIVSAACVDMYINHIFIIILYGVLCSLNFLSLPRYDNYLSS